MTLEQLIAHERGLLAAMLRERQTMTETLAEIRSLAVTENRNLTDEETARVVETSTARDSLDVEIDEKRAKIAGYETERDRDRAVDAELERNVEPTGERVAYDEVARVGQEKRTFSPDTDRTGAQFVREVGLWALRGTMSERLVRHDQESRVDHAAFFDSLDERAAGTGAFAGLTVPQYLTDMYAPSAKANRPFADACSGHDLPASGMTVNISRITTGTSAAVQSSENSSVSETDIDDTLLSPAVKTNAGQQTLSRQAIERGTGVEGVMLDDLFRAYATALDSTLLNEASTGLTNVATNVAYADGSPTVAELYPKFLEALSGVESALLDQDPGDNIAVMHSRRWYWIQNALSSTWPLAAQPGILAQMGVTNFAERYGNGVRGVLPNGTPVVVDNNIGTTLGAGTEDEIYLGSVREFHLWEDPSAPMLIRAEQTKAATLGVLFVVYGYFAYTHTRYAHARKISGTGLIAPTFSGV